MKKSARKRQVRDLNAQLDAATERNASLMARNTRLNDSLGELLDMHDELLSAYQDAEFTIGWLEAEALLLGEVESDGEGINWHDRHMDLAYNVEHDLRLLLHNVTKEVTIHERSEGPA